MIVTTIGIITLGLAAMYHWYRVYSRRLHKTIFVMVNFEGYKIQSLRWVPQGKFRSLHITFQNGRVVREVKHRGFWHDDMGPISDEALSSICYNILCAEMERAQRVNGYPQTI